MNLLLKRIRYTDGCEQHFAGYSVITTSQPWCSEPAGLIAHELAHACGWRHH